MAVFRVQKTKDYTVMSNTHLKDRSLSLKAKGLLSVMLSLPDEWNYTTRGLAAICKEGVDSIGAALKELEKVGYIKRRQLRNSKGFITDMEYTIYEQPQLQETEPAKPDAALPCTAHPDTENPDMDNPDTDSPRLGNPAQLNTIQSKTYESKTQKSNPYPSIMRGAREDGLDEMEAEERMREIHQTRSAVKTQIEYDVLADYLDRDRLDEFVELIVETLCSTRPFLRISGEDIPTKMVKERLRSLNMYHMEYIFHSLENNRTDIKNIRQYMLATLYRAPTTIESHVEADCKHRRLI